MKKFLSVFLSLAMTVSLFTVGASAKSNNTKKTFTDNGSIQYQEAVSVVSACEIINGYKDGSFNPTANLTRGAAAKIISNMMLGPTTASALDANAAPFKDVSTKNVFAGYIAYCAKEGIINGYKDKTFRPTKTVTGFQFMKMLLGALGYDGSIEGFTGKNWTIPVAKLASSKDLDDGNDNFVGSKAMTREEACLYAFNTLKATMVEYDDKGSTVIVNGVEVVQSPSKAEDKENNTKTDGYIYQDNTDKKNGKDGLMQFAEKYFDKLKSKDANDDFGRPGTKWTYDGDEIGTYADDADESLVLNKSGKTLKEILVSDSDYFKYDENDLASTIDIYVNGKSKQVTKADILNNTSDAQDAASYFKAGDQLFVYEDDNNDNDVCNVTAVRYSLAKIDEIDTSLSSTYTKKGATCSITLTSLDGDTSLGGTYYDQYDGNSSKELKGFSSDTYKEGTVLAVAFSEEDSDKIIASNVATVVSGKVSAYNSGSKAKVTIGSKEYSLHDTLATSDKTDASMKSLDFNYNDSTYTAYLDVNNYVIGIDETESVKIDDVYYVTGISCSENGLYGDNYYAQAVALKDGTVTDFKLDTDSDSDNFDAKYLGSKWTYKDSDGKVNPLWKDGSSNISTNTLNTNFAGLYTFEKDGSSYEAKQYNTSSDSTYYVIDHSGRTDADAYKVGNTAAKDVLVDDLKHDDTYLKLTDNTSSKKVYLGKDTNYLKIATPGSDIDVKFVTGGTSVRNNGVEAITVCTKTGSKYVASYVILVSANNDFSNSSSDDMVFISDTSNKTVSYTDADGKTKTGYARDLYFLDGSGKVEEDAVCTKEDHDCGYYTWEKNDDGVYDLDPTNDKLTDNWNSTDPAYDDQTGSVSNVRLESVYDNTLTINNAGITCTDSNSKTVTCTLDDVDLAKNVIIADDRSDSQRDDDAYTSEINSVSKLKAAIDKNNSDVYADVYYDDGEVIMVYVWDVAPSENTVTFKNLPAGLTLTVNGETKTGTGADISVPLSNGTHSYTISGTGYETYTGSVKVNGKAVDVEMPTYVQVTTNNSTTEDAVDGLTLTANYTYVVTGHDVTLTVSGTQAAKTTCNLTAKVGTADATTVPGGTFTNSSETETLDVTKTITYTMSADTTFALANVTNP